MSHNVREHLRLGNEEYDDAIRRFIPGYARMLSVAAEQVASVRPALVLDLGHYLAVFEPNRLDV